MRWVGRVCGKGAGRWVWQHLTDGWLGITVRSGRAGEAVFTEKCSGFDAPCVFCSRIRKPPFGSRQGRFMQLLRALFALLVLGVLCTQDALAQNRFGAQGRESEPDRTQRWLVPGADPDAAAHAILLRPPGDGPFRLALIAHASTQNPLRRAQMPQSEYRALAAFLVARGFAVLVPERPGHGATGGRYLEDQGDCDETDYSGAGRATAEAIVAALNYLRGQSFVRQDGAVILGPSAGAWGALALAGEKVNGLSAIIAFAAGRGRPPHASATPGRARHHRRAKPAEVGAGGG